MKMNRIKLHKQVGTMNKEQLIVLCKSLIDINCELEYGINKKINKAIHYIITNKPIYIDIKGTSCIKNITDDLLDILGGE